jgi:type I restriction enzyme S subunit
MNEISCHYPPNRCLASRRADVFHFLPEFDEIRDIVGRFGQTAQLSEVAQRSKATTNPEDSPHLLFTYVAIDDVDIASGEIVKHAQILGARAPSRARKLMPKGSILVSTVRPRRRAFALVPDSLAGGICSTGFSVLLPNEQQIDRRFLWVFLRSRYGAKQIEQLGRGASYPAVLEHELDGILVPLPDDDFQAKVAEKVSQIFILEGQAQKSLQEAFDVVGRYLPRSILEQEEISSPFGVEQCLAEERADARFFDQRHRTVNRQMAVLANQGRAKILSIGKLGEPLRRGVQPEYRPDGTIPVLKTVDVQNRKVNWAACRKVTEDFFEDHPRGQLCCDDIVITSTGEGSWGRAAICDVERAFAAVDLLVLRINQEIINPYVVVAFLWSEYGGMQFEQRVRGSTGQTHLYKQDVEKANILIPTEDDQRLIARNIQEQFVLLDEAEHLREEAVQDIEDLLGGAE